MKKLTKKKRDLVRFLVKRAMNDLKVAKDITFKAYGSHSFSEYISSALYVLGRSFEGLSRTKLPKEDPIQPQIETTDECPAKGTDCPLQKKEKNMCVDEKDFESRFKSIVCEHLGVTDEQCRSDANFVEDLVADDLDPIELIMAVEEEFLIRITDEESSHVKTYGGLLNLVKNKVNKTF